MTLDGLDERSAAIVAKEATTAMIDSAVECLARHGVNAETMKSKREFYTLIADNIYEAVNIAGRASEVAMKGGKTPEQAAECFRDVLRRAGRCVGVAVAVLESVRCAK